MTETWASPLVEVERAVQQRAKDISLDMASPDGRAALRRLIDEEVSRWSHDYKRSLRAFDLADPAGVAERAERNLAGYGPLTPLLEDDDVWEIMINGPDAIAQPLAGAFAAVTAHAPGRAPVEPRRAQPGSLGSWSDPAQGEAALG